MQTTDKLGLSTAEAAARLNQHGPDVLPQRPANPLWKRFVDQFRSPLIYILLFALAVDLTIWFIEGHAGWPFESVAIAIILGLNSGLGVYQESKAESALEGAGGIHRLGDSRRTRCAFAFSRPCAR